ncbi:hypothetical protein Hanom_Chr16g01452031 [Helianthus anomalus]
MPFSNFDVEIRHTGQKSYQHMFYFSYSAALCYEISYTGNNVRTQQGYSDYKRQTEQPYN